MNVRYINPVLNAMVSVLKTMANLEVKAGRPIVKLDDDALGDVSAMIDMNGTDVEGSIAISFPKFTIIELVKRILSEDISEINESARNLTGEITNIVTGGAKNELDQNGVDIGMSTPTIHWGDDHKLVHKAKGITLVLPFFYDSGNFFVELHFKD